MVISGDARASHHLTFQFDSFNSNLASLAGKPSPRQ